VTPSRCHPNIRACCTAAQRRSRPRSGSRAGTATQWTGVKHATATQRRLPALIDRHLIGRLTSGTGLSRYTCYSKARSARSARPGWPNCCWSPTTSASSANSTASRSRHAVRRATALVAWALGLVQPELCPIDYHLDPQLFVHHGRGHLPDLLVSLRGNLHACARSWSSIRRGVRGNLKHSRCDTSGWP
jgi:hypothetical protein